MAVNNIQLLNSTTDKIHVIDMKNNSGVFVTGDINYDVIFGRTRDKIYFGKRFQSSMQRKWCPPGKLLGKIFHAIQITEVP